MLFDLGRRVERLLYFGSLLLLACFFELYFVSAAVYTRSESPEGVAELISRFESNSERLKTLYEASPTVEATKGDKERNDLAPVFRTP